MMIISVETNCDLRIEEFKTSENKEQTGSLSSEEEEKILLLLLLSLALVECFGQVYYKVTQHECSCMALVAMKSIRSISAHLFY